MVLAGLLLLTRWACACAPAVRITAVAAPAADDASRFRADIRRVEEVLPAIRDRGGALFFLARRHAQLGELPEALALLKQCLSLDEGFDPSNSPWFRPLRSNPEFRDLADDAHRRLVPVHRAQVAFTVAQADLIPEGMAVDGMTFYLGSIVHRKIVRVTPTGEVSDFTAPEASDLLAPNGVRVDPATHEIWAAGFGDDRTELYHFDARGKLLERFSPPGPGKHDFNDLVVRRSGEVYVTDIMAHQVDRLDRVTRSLVPLAFARPLLYPNGIALSDDGDRLYVADMLGVTLVDLEGNTQRDVDPGEKDTLAGIDGLYWYQGSLVGVQYGTGPYRVVRWRLAADGLRVTSFDVLEYGTDWISFPTTGAIADRRFYFLANTGIGNLKDDKIADPSKLEPLRVAVVPLD
jgi:hypothetical protein